MTAPGGPDSIHSSLSQRLLTVISCLTALITAALLWGVGIEAAHFGHRLTGAMLIADAVVVTGLEALTLFYLMLPRNACVRCRRFETLSAGLDTYKRAVLYALLTVTCFVRLDNYWLPAVPGSALILTTLMYMLKHCCNQKVPYNVAKLPSSFVSFDNSACLTPDASPASSSPAAPASGHIIASQRQWQPSPTSFPTVQSAINDYWQGADEEAPVPAIQQPPALPPRRNRPCRLPPSATGTSPVQHLCLITEDCLNE